jgi:hypothetical protein
MLRSKLSLALLSLVVGLGVASVGCGAAPDAEDDALAQPVSTREHIVAAASVADEVMGTREHILLAAPAPGEPVGTREHILLAAPAPGEPVGTREHILLAAPRAADAPAASLGSVPAATNSQITDAVTQ